VVVDQLDIIGVALNETKNNPPVGAHRLTRAPSYRLKSMKTEAGRSHILDDPGLIELVEDGANLIEQIGPNPSRIIQFEEPF